MNELTSEHLTIFEADSLMEELHSLEEQVKAIENRRDEYISRYEEKISRARAMCESECKSIKIEMAVIRSRLRDYLLENMPAGRKSIKTPTGMLKIISKPKQFVFENMDKVKGDDDRLVEFVKKSAPEYIRQKDYVAWGQLKKTLLTEGDYAFLSDGQQLEGVLVKYPDDEFEVEFD